MSCGRSDDNRFLVALFAILKNKKEKWKNIQPDIKNYGGAEVCVFSSHDATEKEVFLQIWI